MCTTACWRSACTDILFRAIPSARWAVLRILLQAPQLGFISHCPTSGSLSASNNEPHCRSDMKSERNNNGFPRCRNSSPPFRRLSHLALWIPLSGCSIKGTIRKQWPFWHAANLKWKVADQPQATWDEHQYVANLYRQLDASPNGCVLLQVNVFVAHRWAEWARRWFP